MCNSTSRPHVIFQSDVRRWWTRRPFMPNWVIQFFQPLHALKRICLCRFLRAILLLCKVLMKKSKDNGWLDWRTYPFGSHVGKKAGTWPSQNQCGVALVDCELFGNKPGRNAITYRDQSSPRSTKGFKVSIVDEMLGTRGHMLYFQDVCISL